MKSYHSFGGPGFIGRVHVTSSPSCLCTLNKRFPISPFVIVHQHGCHAIVLWISRDWLHTLHKKLYTPIVPKCSYRALGMSEFSCVFLLATRLGWFSLDLAFGKFKDSAGSGRSITRTENHMKDVETVKLLNFKNFEEVFWAIDSIHFSLAVPIVCK